MTSTTTTSPPYPSAQAKAGYRWVQLILGVVCMVAAANIQYAWTLFVPEIQKTFGWQRAGIQIAFTIFVLVQTWLTPFEGYLIDRFGPRIIVLIGGFFTGLAWIIDSYAASLTGYYVAAAVGALAWAACMRAASTTRSNGFRIAADLRLASRRGLRCRIRSHYHSDRQHDRQWRLPGRLLLVRLDPGYHYHARLAHDAGAASGRNATLDDRSSKPTRLHVARSRQDAGLYLLFVMFTMTVTGGLMAVAQLGPMSQDLGVKDLKVDLYFFALAALPFALLLDRIMNGISRPLFGVISDYIGRENAMFVAFMLEGLGITALATFGGNPWAFVFLSGVVFLAWGEVYSLFSATSGMPSARRISAASTACSIARKASPLCSSRSAISSRRRPAPGPPFFTRYPGWTFWRRCVPWCCSPVLRRHVANA